MKPIIIKHAYQGNLKNISVNIPRHQITVLTGLSGSGKSTLAADVLYQECQRQYLEAMSYQGIQKPKVERILNTSPAILIRQQDANRNPRSTVGTISDMYTDLRMIYEKLSFSRCPLCGEWIDPTVCKEDLEKTKDGFTVYIDCPHCHQRIEKLTRTYFSHNTKEGACPTCQGLGKVMQIDLSKVIDERLSLEAGAVAFWPAKYRDYQIEILMNAYKHYGISYVKGTSIGDFSDIQKEILLNGVESDWIRDRFPDKAIPKTVQTGKFVGILTMLWRKYSEKPASVQKYFIESQCPDCLGERLHKRSREAHVFNSRLPELTLKSLRQLLCWVTKLKGQLSDSQMTLAESYLLDLETKLNRLIMVGLDYLTLDRQTKTLSGGETQRLKLAGALDSTVTGIIYILDEPTIGLHSKDTAGMISIFKDLRDLGNTVVLIEHDMDVIKEADYIIDLGPGAGKNGGEIVGQGTLTEIMQQKSSVTGQFLAHHVTIFNQHPRLFSKTICIEHAHQYNLKNIDVQLPIQTFTVVTGVSGSGKSTLIFEVLSHMKPDDKNHLIDFDEIVEINQNPIHRMRRSNIATYIDLYQDIRQLFAKTKEAKAQGIKTTAFSFNAKGGRCENCEGLGYVVSNMLFFEDVEVACPICHGQQFQPHILDIHYQGLNIKEVLELSVSEALMFFENVSSIYNKLAHLQKVGLGYLELGQSLTALSGGEAQRLKLAKSFLNNQGRHLLYLLDEPTTGLHPKDVEHFLVLLNELADSGHTVIVVEHNMQVIAQADYVIDLGIGGGDQGGSIVFFGTVENLIQCSQSYTGQYLKTYLGK